MLGELGVPDASKLTTFSTEGGLSDVHGKSRSICTVTVLIKFYIRAWAMQDHPVFIACSWQLLFQTLQTHPCSHPQP